MILKISVAYNKVYLCLMHMPMWLSFISFPLWTQADRAVSIWNFAIVMEAGKENWEITQWLLKCVLRFLSLFISPSPMPDSNMGSAV